MSHDSGAPRSFSARANDPACRDFFARCARFLRARFRRCCATGLLLADDPRVLTAWRRGWDAEHFLRLQRWRDEGFQPRVMFDVGAHTGLWSAMAQSVLSPEKIFLFEPQRELQPLALGRRPAHGANWEMVPLALGERSETTVIHVAANSAASSMLPPEEQGVVAAWGTATVREEKIQVARLDELVATGRVPVPDLVKIDVQGYELAVLAGGRDTIAQAQRVAIEVSLQPIYRGQAYLPEVLHTLSGMGFKLEDWNEGARPWPAPPAQVDLWLRRK